MFSASQRPDRLRDPKNLLIHWAQETLSPGVKGARREADYSPASSAEVKNVVAIPPLPHMSLRSGAVLIKHRDNFTFTLLHNIKYRLHVYLQFLFLTFFKISYI
jgi:hypothetical protein